jgi:hypothetical protein
LCRPLCCRLVLSSCRCLVLSLSSYCATLSSSNCAGWLLPLFMSHRHLVFSLRHTLVLSSSSHYAILSLSHCAVWLLCNLSSRCCLVLSSSSHCATIASSCASWLLCCLLSSHCAALLWSCCAPASCCMASIKRCCRLSWKCRRFRCRPQLVLTTWCRVFPTRRPDTADVSATSCDVGFFFSVSYVVSLPNCRHVVVVTTH